MEAKTKTCDSLENLDPQPNVDLETSTDLAPSSLKVAKPRLRFFPLPLLHQPKT